MKNSRTGSDKRVVVECKRCGKLIRRAATTASPTCNACRKASLAAAIRGNNCWAAKMRRLDELRREYRKRQEERAKAWHESMKAA